MTSNWEKYSKKILKEGKKKVRLGKATDIIEEKRANTPVWFDNVSTETIALAKNGAPAISLNAISKATDQQTTKIGRYLAIDCEMVGVGPGGVESALARVTVVNLHGIVVFDSYVKPKEKVTDYRTAVSGIEPHHLTSDTAMSLVDAQKKIAALFKDRIIIGHAIQNDLKALFLSHPSRNIRDTSRYGPFRKLVKGKTPSLRKLAEHYLSLQIQTGSHSSIEDAQATVALYKLVKNDWEAKLKKNYGIKKGKGK